MIRLALLLLLVSGVARAEFQNPNVLPFGEQEAYLGNAGIALHGSAGAVYYNPGALGFVTDRTASIYGNAYAFNSYSNRIPMGVGNPDAVVNSNSYSGVPLSSVTVFGGAP